MKKVRFGVIGAGGIADRRTIPAMMESEFAELVAVMDADSQAAERVRAKYGAKRAYTDDAALVSDPEVDTVYIASPVVMHAPQCRLAADHGKHILVEKPLAMTAEEGQAVVDYCAKKGVLISAGFMMRFGSYVMEMKRLVAQGKIGEVVSGFAQFTCWYPDLPGSWRQSLKLGGGGALMDMGVHCIDLLQFITGSRVREVAAFNDTQTFNYEVEDASMVMLRLENGAMCLVQSNFNIPDEAAKWRLEFFGTRGRLLGHNVIGQVDGGDLDAVFLDDVGGYEAQQDTRSAQSQCFDVTFGNMYRREIDSFCETLLTGKPLEVPASDAVQVQRVVEAAYRAGREKTVIRLG